jgi:hypothetical protein
MTLSMQALEVVWEVNTLVEELCQRKVECERLEKLLRTPILRKSARRTAVNMIAKQDAYRLIYNFLSTHGVHLRSLITHRTQLISHAISTFPTVIAKARRYTR